MPPVDSLGLIAGEGIFPVLVARGARAAGRRVVCAALHGSAGPDLARECEVFQWVGVVRLGQWIRYLRGQGCSQAIMVGRVRKSRMYERWRFLRHLPDIRTVRLWLTTLRHDKRPYAILSAIADELSASGVNLIDSTTYCQDQLASSGVMTGRQPTDQQWRDIEFGWPICSSLSRMDVGQAIAVLQRDVIAVEALEGTNAMIERAGQLCKVGGWTVIKVSNTRQDMRLDVPVIGVQTIEKMHAAGAGCIVLETGKTMILEKAKVLELADRYRIAVVGYQASEGAG
jgi:UDP-2,3-diacylglucosamine hydrolase